MSEVQLLDSHIEAGQMLPQAEKEAYYTAVVEYLYYGREPQDLPCSAMAVFVAIRPNLDKTRAKSAAGRVGGQGSAELTGGKREANAKQTASKRQANAKQTPSEGEGEEEGEEKDRKGVARAAAPSPAGAEPDPLGEPARAAAYPHPSPSEVEAYVLAGGMHPISGADFVDWFDDHGWPPGGWHGSAARWSRRDRDRAASGGRWAGRAAPDASAFAAYGGSVGAGEVFGEVAAHAEAL